MTQLDLPTAASGPGAAMCTETPHQNKTNHSEETCLSIQGSAQPHGAQGGLLCPWRKRHIPLKWASLGWKPRVSSPDDPRPRLYLCRGGALILGSLPPCRDPGESCRGGQTSPPFCPRVFCFWGKESRLRWADTVTAVTFHPRGFRGGPWEAVPGAQCSPMLGCAAHIFQQPGDLLSVLCFTVWHFSIAWQSSVLSSNCKHVILVQGPWRVSWRVTCLPEGKERSCRQEPVRQGADIITPSTASDHWEEHSTENKKEYEET